MNKYIDRKEQENIISLYCEYSGAPGAGWSSSIEFRPANDGFEVWEKNDDNLNPFVASESTWQMVDKSSEILTWRSAAKWLRKRGFGLGGDFLDIIQVDGVQGYQSEIVAICWMHEDNPAENIIDFILNRSEKDIEYLHSAYGSISKYDAITYIEELCNLLPELKETNQSLIDAAKTYGINVLPKPLKFKDLISDAVDDLERHDYIISKINMAVNKLQSIDISSGLESHQISLRSNVLEKYLLGTSASGANFPHGIQSVDNLGEVDFDILFDRLEGYIRLQPNEILPTEILEFSAKNYPSPQAGEALLRIFNSWLVALPKPKASTKDFNPRIDLSPEASFLYWLFSSSPGKSASYIALENPVGFREMLSWCEARTLNEFGPGMGGAWGIGVHKHAQWKWIDFVQQLRSSI